MISSDITLLYEARHARPNDLATIAFLERTAYANPFDVKGLRDRLRYTTSTAGIVVERRDDPIIAAYALIEFHPTAAFVGRFGVLPDARRQGVGSFLAHELIDRFTMPKPEVQFYMDKTNNIAMSFMEQIFIDGKGLEKREYECKCCRQYVSYNYIRI